MFLYLLKVSFVIGAALLFYKTVLQQESFFSTNRFYLLGSILLAFALPFVSLPPLVSHQGYLTAVLQQDTPPTPLAMPQAQAPAASARPAFTAPAIAEPKEPVGEQLQAPVVSGPVPDKAKAVVQTAIPETQAFSWQGEWLYGLWMLYFFGVAVFALNLLVQIGSVLFSAARSTDKIRDGAYIIVNTEGAQAPCSFFRYIFVCPDDYDFATYSQIVAHEKIHARQGHTLDMLVAELAVVALWFNPLMWFYRREVEKNVEYQTDAMLLQEVPVNKNQYQLSLLRIACPNKALSITTNYNQSLLKQRIMMMNAKKSTLHGYWKYSFLVPLFFGSLLVLNEPASSKTLPGSATLDELTIWDFSAPAFQEKDKPAKEKAKPEKKEKVKEVAQPEEKKPVKDKEPLEPARTSLRAEQNVSGNFDGLQTDISEGYWYSHQEGNTYCIELKGSKSNSTWNISRCFDKSLFQKKGNELFVLTKETGTLQLTGNLDAEVGQGKYTFTEDAAFKKYLTANNIESNDRNLIFHLFLGDVDKQYVEFLKKNYDRVEGDRLLELAIFGISMQEYQNYIALFQKHSNKKPLIREVVEARIHGIDEAYVQEMQKAGFQGLSMQKLMEAKIHGVNSAYVNSLQKAGFADITLDKAVQAKIHGLTPASIQEIKQLGYGDLSLDKLMEVNIHGVDAAYIADLKSAGFDKLSLDQVIEAKIHGLDAPSAKEIRGMGFKDLAFRDILTAQIHGVDAAYVADLKKAGLQNLSMDDAVAAKIHGIDSDFIQKAKKDGYKLETVDEYVTLKIHGMALESLKKKD